MLMLNLVLSIKIPSNVGLSQGGMILIVYSNKPNKDYINNLAFLTRIQMVPVVKALKRMIKSSKTWICLKWKSLHEILGFAHS